MKQNNPYRFDLLPMFQNETIRGKQYTFLTAYFVNPGTYTCVIFSIFRFKKRTTSKKMTHFQPSSVPPGVIRRLTMPRGQAVVSTFKMVPPHIPPTLSTSPPTVPTRLLRATPTVNASLGWDSITFGRWKNGMTPTVGKSSPSNSSTTGMAP